jgi:hypothetical protein
MYKRYDLTDELLFLSIKWHQSLFSLSQPRRRLESFINNSTFCETIHLVFKILSGGCSSTKARADFLTVASLAAGSRLA